jgi:hypothetical protein
LNEILPPAPFEHDIDLGRLSDAGTTIVLSPKGEELRQLAQWAGVDSIEAFTATVDLARKSLGNYRYEATIEADITQSCVVTLEPLKSHISTKFGRDLHLARTARHAAEVVEGLVPGAGEDDVPEELTSTHYDIAGPVLEEFSLAIDPYPKAPGAAFESPSAPDGQAENPFAVLKRLKTGV